MAAWTHIDHSSLSLPAATVTWTGISGSYDHLLIKVSGISARTATYYDYVKCEFNNDTTAANYSYTQLYADSATPNTGAGVALPVGGFVNADASGMAANVFGTLNMWIPHYSQSDNFKQCFSESYGANQSNTNSRWIVCLNALLWHDTPAAITEIDLSLGYAGDNWMANSTFDLYGITGA